MFDALQVTTNLIDRLGRHGPSTAYYAESPYTTTSGGPSSRLIVSSPEQLSAQMSVLTFVAGASPRVAATPNSPATGQPQTPADIENIRQLLGLSVSTVADVFGVSRQAVYKWLAGDPMNQEHMNRLAQLREAAPLLTGFARSDTRALTRRKLPSGRTVVESISVGEDPVSVARTAAELLRRDAEQRNALDSFLGNRSRPQRGISSFVTPHAGEDLEEA